MESDLLVIVDHNDNIINDVAVEDRRTVSKKDAHTFNGDQPRGILHRAFSLFCFNEDGEILLTRRAETHTTQSM